MLIIALGNIKNSAILGLSNSCYACLSEYATNYSPLTGNVTLTNTAQSGTLIYGYGNVILVLTLTTYLIIAFYSVVFAYNRLSRPGVSKEVRAMCFKKHLYYVLMFVVIWTI